MNPPFWGRNSGPENPQAVRQPLLSEVAYLGPDFMDRMRRSRRDRPTAAWPYRFSTRRKSLAAARAATAQTTV